MINYSGKYASLVRFAAEFGNFLRANDIDMEKVKLVIRCDDIETEAKVEQAVNMMLINDATGSHQSFTYNGLRFAITNLDAAKV